MIDFWADHAQTCSRRKPPHPAILMPGTRDGNCAAQCGHWLGDHDDAGCKRCDCPAPHGRIMPGPAVPDDPSSLTAAGES